MLDLLSSHAVRSRCGEVTQLVRHGLSEHFTIDDQALERCAVYVADECRKNYPTLEIPVHSRWRHFLIQGTDLWDHYVQHHQIRSLSKEEQAKAAIDLVSVSVLLDAGAGADWHFFDPVTGTDLSRSEGLAAASVELFFEYLGSDLEPGFGLTVDRLSQLSLDEFANCFQVSDQNPLVGMKGRIDLLHNLGSVLDKSTRLSRPGDLLSVISRQSSDGIFDIADLLHLVLIEFNSIWPNGLRVDGENIGDAGVHKLLGGNRNIDNVVPFHKLSQWLCYSLIEPLQWANFEVVNQNGLTGLPEYRNGGLFIDTGVIRPRNSELLKNPLDIRSEAIVEWRALTVSLIDVVAQRVRTILNRTEEQLPLGSVLQGGTWSAGRRIAGQLRSDLSPPLELNLDGTIF